jgi:hypothetical protein
MVLGRRADHRRAADVYGLDALGKAAATCHRRLERVEIDREQVDRADAVALHRLAMGGIGPVGQQAAMHHRVQRLDPPAHHLGEIGDLGDVAHPEPGLAQESRGPAGRDQPDAERLEPAGEVGQPALVRDGEKRGPDGRDPAIGGFGSGLWRHLSRSSLRRVTSKR